MSKIRDFVTILILIYCIVALRFGPIYTKTVLFHVGNVPIFTSEVLLCAMFILLF